MLNAIIAFLSCQMHNKSRGNTFISHYSGISPDTSWDMWSLSVAILQVTYWIIDKKNIGSLPIPQGHANYRNNASTIILCVITHTTTEKFKPQTIINHDLENNKGMRIIFYKLRWKIHKFSNLFPPSTGIGNADRKYVSKLKALLSV